MRRNTKTGKIAIMVILCGLLLAQPAYGYIDPNATNLLTQVLTPLFLIAATGLTFLRKRTRAAIGWLADRIHRRKK